MEFGIWSKQSVRRTFRRWRRSKESGELPGRCSSSWATRWRFSWHDWIASRANWRIEERLFSSVGVAGVNVDATSWSNSSSSSSFCVPIGWLCDWETYRLWEICDDVDWANAAERCVASSSKNVLDRSDGDWRRIVEALLFRLSSIWTGDDDEDRSSSSSSSEKYSFKQCSSPVRMIWYSSNESSAYFFAVEPSSTSFSFDEDVWVCASWREILCSWTGIGMSTSTGWLPLINDGLDWRMNLTISWRGWKTTSSSIFNWVRKFFGAQLFEWRHTTRKRLTTRWTWRVIRMKMITSADQTFVRSFLFFVCTKINAWSGCLCTFSLVGRAMWCVFWRYSIDSVRRRRRRWGVIDDLDQWRHNRHAVCVPPVQWGKSKQTLDFSSFLLNRAEKEKVAPFSLFFFAVECTRARLDEKKERSEQAHSHDCYDQWFARHPKHLTRQLLRIEASNEHTRSPRSQGNILSLNFRLTTRRREKTNIDPISFPFRPELITSIFNS